MGDRQAGFVNVITRNGGNASYREALFYWAGDGLDAASRQVLRVSPTDASRAEYVTYADDNYDQLEPGFTVGGPLARDRVWMFGGYVPSLRDTVRSVIFRDGSSGTHRQQLARHHATANINAQFGSRWRARGYFNSGSQRQEGLLPPLDGSGNSSANFAIDDSRRIIRPRSTSTSSPTRNGTPA